MNTSTIEFIIIEAITGDFASSPTALAETAYYDYNNSGSDKYNVYSLLGDSDSSYEDVEALVESIWEER